MAGVGLRHGDMAPGVRSRRGRRDRQVLSRIAIDTQLRGHSSLSANSRGAGTDVAAMGVQAFQLTNMVANANSGRAATLMASG